MKKAMPASTKAISSSCISVPGSVIRTRNKTTKAISEAKPDKNSKQQTWLTRLQSSHLKRLAFLTGQPSNGTKSTLSTLLADSLVKPRLPFPGARILSVDMGVKNLGVCLLEVNGLRKWGMFDDDVNHHSSATTITSGAGSSHSTATKGFSDDVNDGKADVDSSEPAIKVLEWTRLDLSHRLIQLALKGSEDSGYAANLFASEAAAVAVGKDKDNAHHQIHENFVAGEDDNDRIGINTPPQPSPSSSEQQANIYTPSNLSKVAYILASQFVAYKPDVILIERQRFRSGGAPAIQEWTVRVNMLESMLWASLETMKHARVEHSGGDQSRFNSTSSEENGRSNSSSSDGTDSTAAITDIRTFPDVVEMSPRRIGSFWLTALEEQEAKKVQQGDEKAAVVSLPTNVVAPLEVDSDDAAASASFKKTDIKRRAFEKKDKISLVRQWLSEAEKRENEQSDDGNGRRGSIPNTLEFDKRVWPVVSVFRRLTSSTTTRPAAVSIETTKKVTKRRGTKAKKNKDTATDDDGDNISDNDNETSDNKNSHDEHSIPAVSDSSTRSDAASSALSNPSGSSEQHTQQLQQTLARPGKLDDLADCLVQGVTFALWEENRRRLSSRHHVSSSSK